MKPKSKSAQAEALLVASEIAQATSFAAHIRCGPHEKHTVRDLHFFDDAFRAAEKLTADHGRFGRRAMVFAISARGRETLVTPELAELAKEFCQHGKPYRTSAESDDCRECIEAADQAWISRTMGA